MKQLTTTFVLQAAPAGNPLPRGRYVTDGDGTIGSG